jgi:acyl-coenzyme A synthetase/AMP-(fatty) acid ligase
MIIDRNVINKDLILSEFLSDNSTIISHNYQQFCQLINQIKHTLLEKGAKKSDTVALIQHRINAFHIASVFAVCELGMQLLIVDFPSFGRKFALL